MEKDKQRQGLTSIWDWRGEIQGEEFGQPERQTSKRRHCLLQEDKKFTLGNVEDVSRYIEYLGLYVAMSGLWAEVVLGSFRDYE